MSKNNAIISFEGLDCSFKETNYKKYTFHLREMRGDYFKIHKESFPRYGNWSAMGVEKWLNGSFDRDVLKAHPTAVNSLYCMDRFSYWYETCEDGTRRIDLLNDKDNYHYFVFDRYTLSNFIYNPIYPNEVNYNDFNFDKDLFAIPHADVTVWMRMNNFDVLSKLIAQKENKDKNELDTDFLRKVWERSEKIISSDIFEKSGIRLVVVECLNPDGTTRDKKDLADYIWGAVCRSIR